MRAPPRPGLLGRLHFPGEEEWVSGLKKGWQPCATGIFQLQQFEQPHSLAVTLLFILLFICQLPPKQHQACPKLATTH